MGVLRFMRLIARLALLAFGALTVVRLALFLGYAAAVVPNTQFQAFHLESKMVHLAWRVQAGERLYPEWRSYPHVCNFFAPLYFILVGWLGRAVNSSLEGLYLIGRSVSFLATLGTSLVVALDVSRRYGRGCAFVAALATLGVAPLFGYGVMVRPDTFADLLGLAGFLAVVRGTGRSSTLLGGVLLILATMTKQTAAIYLVPAALALNQLGRRPEAAALVTFVAGVLLGTVLAVDLLVEPNFGPSLLAEGKTSWSWKSWNWTMYRFVATDPEWLVLLPVGLWLWTRAGRRDPASVWLTLVLVPAFVLSVAKQGSDLNYGLGFRAIGGFAIASLWDVVWSDRGPERPPRAILALASCACLLAVYSVFHSVAQWANADSGRVFLESQAGKTFVRLQARLFRMMTDPSNSVLTDASQLDIRQGARTAFGDPWLFHLLVDAGEIDPERMRQWIEDERYAWIITTKDFRDPAYDDYDFGLPRTLVVPARQHYRFEGSAAGFFLYRPLHSAGQPGGFLP